jgi:hypothetical protein
MSDAAPETTAVPLYSSAAAAAAPPDPTDAAAPEAATTHAPAPSHTLKDAVHNCRRAYNQALTAEKARGKSDHAAETKAAEAYCANLPILTTEGNIRAFIACVAHGMAIGVIGKDEGLKLIYAARTALISMPRESRPVGRPKTNIENQYQKNN